MTFKQWKGLSHKDKRVLKALNILDLVRPREKISSKSKALPPLEPYVLKRANVCRVCESAFTKYFRMTPSTKHILLSEEIKKEDILPEDTVKKGRDCYSGCPHCYTVLSKNSKEELIKQIIQLSRGKKL